MRRPVPVLVALIAVLLSAGGFALATDGPDPEVVTGSGRVGAAGFAQEALTEDRPAALVTTTVAPPSTVTTTTLPPAPALKLPPALPGLPATTVPPRASAPPPNLPPLPPPPTIKPAPLAIKWSKTTNAISVRMHMEPATPVAGQPVTFIIDEVTAPVPCCIIHLVPELGVTIPIPGAGGENPENDICGSPPVTRTGLSYTHTFAEPGVYPLLLIVLSGGCQAPAGGSPSVTPPSGVDIRACILVGPEAAARARPIPPACAGS